MTPDLQFLLDTVLRAGKPLAQLGAQPASLQALLWDAYASRGQFLSEAEVAALRATGQAASLQALACALVEHITGDDARQGLDTLFQTTLPDLARFSQAGRGLDDPEGTEELVRLVLRDLGAVPQGETPEAASNRLQAVSILERRRLLELSREAEQRSREIREQLSAQAARESADKYSRE